MPVGRDNGTYPHLLECTCLHSGRAGSHRGLPERYPLKAKLAGRECRVLTEGWPHFLLTPSSRRAAMLSQLRKDFIPRGGTRCSWKKTLARPVPIGSRVVRPLPIGSRVGSCCCAPAVVSGHWLLSSKASEKAQRGPGLP